MGVIPPDSIIDSNILRFFDGSLAGGCDCARLAFRFVGSSTGVGVGPGVWALLRFFGFLDTFCSLCDVNFHRLHLGDLR